LSTILKALKRIDQTTPEPEDIQSWPPIIDTKETFRSRLSRIWLHRKVFLAITLAGVVIAAGWLVYSQKHRLISQKLPEKTSANGPVYQAKIYPNPSESENPAKEKSSALNHQDSQPAPQPGQNSLRNDMPSKPLAQLQRQQNTPKKQIYPSSREALNLEKQVTVKSGTQRPQPASPNNSILSNPRPSPAAPAGKSTSRVAQVVQSYRHLDNSDLKLQAIAWSDDAGKRIAVINGHIVREGESVDGFSVNQIRQEDVIVNDGTESWRLEFGLK
jgi:Type II secretion system protein B